MHFRKFIVRLQVVPIVLAACASLAAGQAIPSGRALAQSTPSFVSTAASLGAEDQSKVIDVSIWLKVHNREGLDALYGQLYDSNSSRFHSWVTRDEFASKFAPTAAEANQVSAYLSAHGLRVLSVGPNNMFVRAQAAVGAVSKAFHVSLNRYQVNGKVYRANSSDPFIEGPTAALVGSVSGLDSAEMVHPYTAATVKGRKAARSKKLLTTEAVGPAFFSPTCLTGPVSETVGTPGTYPYAVYTGNKYDSTDPGCGYTPDEIQTAYNLKALYKEGFDGTGQTIVIIDWCGSPTILQDANAFSARFGLPPLTKANFNIVNYPGPSTCAAPDPEINIDVEWAHAIAPGANITLLVPPSATFIDTDTAEYYAIVSGLGNVISGSYGSEEYYDSRAEILNQSLINEVGAVFGVAVNFSSGDSGDFTFDFPQSNPRSVSAPADSPYATAVGGVSLTLNKDNTIHWQTGWGTNETLLTSGAIFDPPLNLGFNFGSGGGASRIFAKPTYQRNLPGGYRQLPDISWLGDPFTGAIITITEPFNYPSQILTVYGGTSLACPMFSALWAIADQEAGASLGQAAPHLYSMPKGTITDVLPVGSPSNVYDFVHTSPTHIDRYSGTTLAMPLENTKYYTSAIWDVPDSAFTTLVLTFGTDSGLVTTPGWDNVTGLGTPNGKAFADYFNPAKPK